MQTLYEDELVEAVIGLCTAGRLAGVTPKQVTRFHADRERCYAIVDPDRRVEGFARVHLDWFGIWGLRDRLAIAVGHFPELTQACVAVVFRLARGRQDEGADLYRDAQGNRRAVVALRADRVVTEPMLVGFLHHELAHLADLVSPEFGGLERSGLGSVSTARTASQERLIRERYRLLWALRIDGELTRRGLPGLGSQESRRSEFDRAFGFLSEARRSEVFDGLWQGTVATHDALLRLAADPRELEGRREPVPGAPCPLCGFAAFRWADANGLRPAALERLRCDFPNWYPHEPVCARCAEIYDAVAGLEYPSTVCV